MTTQARNKDKKTWINDKLKAATWNVRGIALKETELAKHLKRKKIDFAAISETKKKLKGTKYVDDYIMIYSGVKQDQRASKGVALYIHKKWEGKIKDYEYVNERIVLAKLKISRGNLIIIAVYAPEEGKKTESKTFYEQLQKVLDKYNSTNQIILMGDLNARIGNIPIPHTIGTFGEDVCNENGKILRDFATFNQLKISNSFFRKKEIHKYTWTARGYRSVIDYIMTNSKLAGQVRDTRVYRGADIGSDHFLVTAEIDTFTRWKNMRKLPERHKEENVYKVYLLEDDSIKDLYQKRMTREIAEMETKDDIDEEWRNLTKVVNKVANEALGKKTKYRKRKGLRIWTSEIELAVKEKQEAFNKYINNNSEQNLENYRQKRNEAKRVTRQAHEESWNRYISHIENDVHGRQTLAYKVMKTLNKQEKDRIQINPIEEEKWIEHYQNLWYDEAIEQAALDEIPILDENPTGDNCIIGLDEIEFRELNEALQAAPNRKATGMDGVNTELWKYGGLLLHLRLLHLFNVCWKSKRIPEEWQKAHVISLFKKGNKNECTNYRGISLLNSAYKIYAKILNNRLKVISEHKIGEEQIGFRKGRSTIDGVFTLQQLIEKHREFNRETHLAFIDFEKAFDNLNREKLWEIMFRQGYPPHLINAIKSLYINTEIVINTGKKITNPVRTNKGVRQGCCISPTLFNIYIDDVIRTWKTKYKNGIRIDRDTVLNIILYADDLTLIAESEDDLQRAIYKLQQVCVQYHMKISAEKTKIMAFEGTQPVRSKIVINNKILEQIKNFQYLGCNISYEYNHDIEQKLNKFTHVCGTITRTLKNKTRKDTLLRFYKTIAVPTITYGSEAWTTTKKEESRIQAQEMKFLRRVKGCTRRDQIRNETIREELNIYELNEKIKDNRRKWKQHLDRMENERIPQKILNYRSSGRRSLGRPRKRWVP